MKNNLGFSLSGTMIIAAIIAVLVTIGMMTNFYRTKEMEAHKISFRGNQVQTNLNNVSESSLEQMSTMEFEN